MLETWNKARFAEHRAQANVTYFRYTQNVKGFVFLQICAGVSFAVAFATYAITHFTPAYWIVFAGALVSLGCALLLLVAYWVVFAKTSAVAFDRDHLYIIGLRQVRRIPWRSLSREAAGLHEEAQGAQIGTLSIRLGERPVPLRLFNPFVWIEDFPTLLVEVLSQIKNNQERTED